MIKFKVVDNMKLDELVKEVETTLSRTLESEGRNLVDGIKSRTQSGKDYQNKGFKEYSNSYAAAKARVLGSSSPVNLTRTGSMLNSIRSKLSRPLELEISVTGTFNQDKARWNQGERTKPARDKKFTPTNRKFLGVDTKQVQQLIQKFINKLKL